MAIEERFIEYDCDGTLLEGFLAFDSAAAGPLAAVAVAHAWGGRGDFDLARARDLAANGYVGFALDMYGKGVRGNSVEENQSLMAPFMEDRRLVARRMQRAIEVLREQAEVDADRVAAIGFCFGGLCVLDLARAGSDVRGVVSFHGLFVPPGPVAQKPSPISARILCLHGYNDPMVEPQSVLDLGAELTAAGADWQLHAYGNTMHAFTVPEANDPDFGAVYSESADRRSHRSLYNFLEEIF
ncbi:MAG: dienelactone hydrolase family protein [Chromatocurvus sp.]